MPKITNNTDQDLTLWAAHCVLIAGGSVDVDDDVAALYSTNPSVTVTGYDPSVPPAPEIAPHSTPVESPTIESMTLHPSQPAPAAEPASPPPPEPPVVEPPPSAEEIAHAEAVLAEAETAHITEENQA